MGRTDERKGFFDELAAKKRLDPLIGRLNKRYDALAIRKVK